MFRVPTVTSKTSSSQKRLILQKNVSRNHVLPLFPFAPAAPRHHDTTPHWCCRRRQRRRRNPPKPPHQHCTSLAIEAITRPQATHRNTRTNTKNQSRTNPERRRKPLYGYQIPFRVWCNQSSQKEVNSPNRNHKPPRTKRQGGAHVI
jgi:hypothetical protein